MRKMMLLLGLALSLSCFSQNRQGYQNPVIPSFHPDPSACRAGGMYQPYRNILLPQSLHAPISKTAN